MKQTYKQRQQQQKSFNMYSPSKAINQKPEIILQYQQGCLLTLMIFL